MKQNNEMNIQDQTDDMQEDNEVDTMNEDVVEEFARQLDRIVRIQDEQEMNNSNNDDDDDSDNGSNDYDMMGYQQLPQDDDDNENDETAGYFQQIESDNEEEEVVDMRAPLSIRVSNTNSIDPDTSDLIKSIMNNIPLPDESIPDWAKKIPESAWFPRVSDKN